MELLHTLDAKKAKIEQGKPFSPAMIKHLDKWFRIESTYASNALDGNELTKQETEEVLEKGTIISGKPERDSQEAMNHAAAFDYVELTARTVKEKDLRLSDICIINELLLKKISDEHAGGFYPQYQFNHPVNFPNVKSTDLIEQMDKFIHWIHNAKEHPVLIAADAHLKLISIHPFKEANGKTARLFMNLILVQHGYAWAIVSPAEKNLYDEAMTQALKYCNSIPFYTLIIQMIDRSFDKYLS